MTKTATGKNLHNVTVTHALGDRVGYLAVLDTGTDYLWTAVYGAIVTLTATPEGAAATVRTDAGAVATVPCRILNCFTTTAIN